MACCLISLCLSTFSTSTGISLQTNTTKQREGLNRSCWEQFVRFELPTRFLSLFFLLCLISYFHLNSIVFISIPSFFLFFPRSLFLFSVLYLPHSVTSPYLFCLHYLPVSAFLFVSPSVTWSHMVDCNHVCVFDDYSGSSVRLWKTAV